MNFPCLSIEIINSSLSETLSVLQGVSRYVESIFIKKKLIEKEGIKVIDFLIERYPNKKIILNITDWKKKDEFILSIIKKTKIKNFLISGGNDNDFKELCLFLEKKKKKLFFFGNNFDLSLLQELKIKDIFYYKPENKKKLNYWNNNDLKNIENLIKKEFYVTVGNILEKDIENLSKQKISQFVVSEEICYSFNPIETCKLIYSKIKKYYPKNK